MELKSPLSGRSNALLADIVLLVVGSFLEAFAYAAFCLPNQIVPGGIYGLTIAINHLTKGVLGFADGFPIGVTALFFNVPLFMLAWKKLGLSSAGKTLATFLMISLFSDLISNFMADTHLAQGDTLLSAFYGGGILGLGVFLVFKAGGTSAGTDILGRVLTVRRNVKLSTMIIVIDSCIVLVGLLVFRDWTVPLYSWITIVVYGQILNVFMPENPQRAVFIISSKPHRLRDLIVNQLGLSATYLHGKGMYSGVDKEVIFMLVERKDYRRLQQCIQAEDPEAFITTTSAARDVLAQLTKTSSVVQQGSQEESE
ncbi:MAG: YitT family protein [Porphyromonas sp.]|nr:YitT family protein [Porphyromonas sp.]